jgi:hypothetical protein
MARRSELAGQVYKTSSFIDKWCPDSQKSCFHAILISEIIWVAELPLIKLQGLSLFLVLLMEVSDQEFFRKRHYSNFGVCQP